jgi:3-isopropylmalate/(R)-2-methylmalate dehydratase small subunit
MQKFSTHTGLVAPIDRANVDTDAIMPKQFLKSIRKTGFGPHLFDEWRYKDPGYYGKPESERQPNPDFVLNQPRYKGASVLLARKNFGCGSSREHAPWALQQYGFRALIAPSFADIFFNNCFNNGILPIALPEEICATLLADAENGANATFTVNLVTQTIVRPDGSTVSFEIDPSRKQKLLEGLDAVGETLVAAPAIEKFESSRALSQPWLSNPVQIGAP